MKRFMSYNISLYENKVVMCCVQCWQKRMVRSVTQKLKVTRKGRGRKLDQT